MNVIGHEPSPALLSPPTLRPAALKKPTALGPDALSGTLLPEPPPANLLEPGPSMGIARPASADDPQDPFPVLMDTFLASIEAAAQLELKPLSAANVGGTPPVKEKSNGIRVAIEEPKVEPEKKNQQEAYAPGAYNMNGFELAIARLPMLLGAWPQARLPAVSKNPNEAPAVDDTVRVQAPVTAAPRGFEPAFSLQLTPRTPLVEPIQSSNPSWRTPLEPLWKLPVPVTPAEPERAQATDKPAPPRSPQSPELPPFHKTNVPPAAQVEKSDLVIGPLPIRGEAETMPAPVSALETKIEIAPAESEVAETPVPDAPHELRPVSKPSTNVLQWNGKEQTSNSRTSKGEIPRLNSRPTPATKPGIVDAGPATPVNESPLKRQTDFPDRNDRHIDGNPHSQESQLPVMEAPQSANCESNRPVSPGPTALKAANEPEIKAAAAPQPARQISLQVENGGATKVNIDLTQKAGKVQVTVRTPDHELAKSLQTDLGDLVGRLEDKGFKTEAWIPVNARHAAIVGEPSNANAGQSESRNSGNSGGHQQPQQQNSSNQRQQARWAAHLEHMLSGNKE